MIELQKQFQEETKQSFDGIAINGVHLEYINWLETQIKALRIKYVSGQVCSFYISGMDTSRKCNNCGKNQWEH